MMIGQIRLWLTSKQTKSRVGSEVNGKGNKTHLCKLVLRNSYAVSGEIPSHRNSAKTNSCTAAFAIIYYNHQQLRERCRLCITYSDSCLRLHNKRRTSREWPWSYSKLVQGYVRSEPWWLQIRNNLAILQCQGWLTTYWIPGFQHCRNWGRGTYYNEYMKDSMHIIVSPIDHIRA